MRLKVGATHAQFDDHAAADRGYNSRRGDRGQHQPGTNGIRHCRYHGAARWHSMRVNGEVVGEIGESSTLARHKP
jgi:hypothetical protein